MTKGEYRGKRPDGTPYTITWRYEMGQISVTQEEWPLTQVRIKRDIVWGIPPAVIREIAAALEGEPKESAQ